ncbi:MAG: TetR/AcrR family transcriptional regulator [Streptosporangiaceae bacterium]|nr:TetR/AcrR family transcriptional regulator [Streptosporangiaceae bacterium]
MSDTKERIISVSAGLLRRQGYTGTGVKQIVTAADAPFGSLYHFFPGGKEQLGAETIRWSGEMYGRLLPLIFDSTPDLVSGVRAFFAEAARDLEDSDYAEGCPIATVALEVSSLSDPLRQACADVFMSWIEAGTRRFAAAGLPEAPARQLVTGMLAALEGGFVLCRALRDSQPLKTVGEQVARAVAAVIDGDV